MAQENPIRLLTQEEQESYSTAVVYGIIIIPAFRDAVALLRPFYDGGAKTAYTDRFARVGLSPWFFSLNIYQRASVILHETMHVLNNHFAREDALSADPKLGNICGDFEINCGLDMLPKVDLSVGIFPDKNPYSYKRYLSLEQYYHLLKEDINQGEYGDGTDPDCPQHGKNKDNSSNPPQPTQPQTPPPTTPQASPESSPTDSGPDLPELSEDGGDEGGGSASGESEDTSSKSDARGPEGAPGMGKAPGAGLGDDSESDGSGGGRPSNGSGTGSNGSGGEEPSNSNSEGKGTSEPKTNTPGTGNGDTTKPSSDDNSSGNGDIHSESGACTCPTDGLPLGKPNNEKGSGNQGEGCDDPTEDRSTAADEAGVERASDAEQTIAKKNTSARVVEEIKKGRSRGNESLHDFLLLAQRQMAPAKVNWRDLFRRAMATANDEISRGRSDYSYRRVNRRAHGSEYIFPGMVKYIPKSTLGIDCSGSMDTQDFNIILNEAEGIMKSSSKGKDAFRVFPVDTQVKHIQPVKSVNNIKLTGGGGTDMSVAVQFINEMDAKTKPDIFVLATDGFTDWVKYENQAKLGVRKYIHILLVTQKDGYKSVPESLRKIIHVIDVSKD